MKVVLWLFDGASLRPAGVGTGLGRQGCTPFGRPGRQSLHLTSTFSVRESLTLAQGPCAAKSNKITSILRLLDHRVPGAVVTSKAACCLMAIVSVLLAHGVLHLELARGQGRSEQGVQVRQTFRPNAPFSLLRGPNRMPTVGPDLDKGICTYVQGLQCR